MDMWVWSVVLFLLAMTLMVMELFVPSGGVLGSLAVLAIVGSLVVAFLDGWGLGATMLVLESIVIPLFLVSALKWWPHTPIGQRILNPPPENADDVLPENDPRFELRGLIGKLGRAKTTMMPSGIVVIEGRSFDAVGEGVAIEVGQTVRVVGVDLNRLEVRPCDPRELDSTRPTPPVSSPMDDVLARPIESLGLEPLDETPKT